jgi:hypothetical protein
MSIIICPNCKMPIGDEISQRFFNEPSTYFDFECPSCLHTLEIEVEAVPVFKVIENIPPAESS